MGQTHRHPASGRVLARALLVCALALTIAAVHATTARATDRTFAQRFSATTEGEITSAGNTVMTCPTAAPGCTAGLSDTSETGADDNDFNEQLVDIDSDPSTFDSSSSQLTVPASSTVLFAGLYYGGEWESETGPPYTFSQGTSATDQSALADVKLATPASGGYVDLTASNVDTATLASIRYQGFVDVTSLVAAGGSGTYTVGNVQAVTGSDAYGGWALVVAYSNPADTMHNLTVYDGFTTVSGNSVDLTANGFVTPPTGAVKAEATALAYETDAGFSGDQLSLDGHVLSDAVNPSDDFFNGTISRDGASVTTKDPNFENQLGIDLDQVNADGLLPNGSTSATLTATSVGDVYHPGMLALSIAVYAPKITPRLTVSDVTTGQTAPSGPLTVDTGDTLRYSLALTNSGQDLADAVKAATTLPAGLALVPNSIQVTSGPNAGAKTDAAGDDQADWTAGALALRLGSGATGALGGTLGAGGGATTVTFEATVDPTDAEGQTIASTAGVTYTAHTAGTAMSATSDPSTVTVHVPHVDLAIAISRAQAFTRGSAGTYRLSVSNVSGDPTTGTITVADTFPDGITPTAASGAGWNCSIVGQALTCTRSAQLAGYNGAPDISVAVEVATNAPTSWTDTATVAANGDVNHANDSSGDSGALSGSGDAGVTIVSTPAQTVVGNPATYVTTVTDYGPDSATGVTLTITLGAPVEGVGISASSGTCTQALPIQCSFAVMNPGESETVTLTATPTKLGPVNATAHITAATGDLDLSNDTASANPVQTAVPPTVFLRVGETPSDIHVTRGEVVNYVLRFQAHGRKAALDVRVCSTIPKNTSLVAVRDGGKHSGSSVCWSRPKVANASTAFVLLHMSLRVAAKAPYARLRTDVTAQATNAVWIHGYRVIRVVGPHFFGA